MHLVALNPNRQNTKGTLANKGSILCSVPTVLSLPISTCGINGCISVLSHIIATCVKQQRRLRLGTNCTMRRFFSTKRFPFPLPWKRHTEVSSKLIRKIFWLLGRGLVSKKLYHFHATNAWNKQTFRAQNKLAWRSWNEHARRALGTPHKQNSPARAIDGTPGVPFSGTKTSATPNKFLLQHSRKHTQL